MVDSPISMRYVYKESGVNGSAQKYSITEKKGKGGVIWRLKLALWSIYRVAISQKVANADSRLC